MNPAMVVALAAILPGVAELPERVELSNEHVAVTFADRGDGLRLAAVVDRRRGQEYRFRSSQAIAMLIVAPSSIHDPDVPMHYAFQDDFELRAVEVAPDRTAMALRFRHPRVDVEVAYRLDPQAAELRKTTTCTARDGGAYVAGVTPWMFRPEGLERSWPPGSALGQPAVFLAPRGGCFVTLEWPRARFVSIEGDVRIAYRPGCKLAPGQSREIAAGTIGLFGAPGRTEEERLDDARQAFFRHVARRVKPQVPFPVKFTTWGPWLGQARADRILRVLDDLEYIAWNDKLYSAPLVARLEGESPATYCLIVPRPEQPARLSIELTARVLDRAKTLLEPPAPEAVWQEHAFELEVPAGKAALRFHPVVRQAGHVAVPGDLALIHFRIDVEREGKRTPIWADPIPPFAVLGRGPVSTSSGGMAWWRDRVVSLADLEGERVRIRLSAAPADGRRHPQMQIGYDRLEVVDVSAPPSQDGQ